MAKTTKDNRRQDRRSREPKEYGEHVLQIARVTRVVKGGRRMRFRAAVVIGNRKGKVGLGLGKAGEVQGAIQKAVAHAKRKMILVPLHDGTIPHEIDHKYKAARIRLLPASEGTGIIAGGALRPILELAGVRNVLSKRYGSTNLLVNAQATIDALVGLRERPSARKAVDEEGEKRIDDLKVVEEVEADSPIMPSALIVIAKEGYQDQEYSGTRKGLLGAGYEVTVASTRTGRCTGKYGENEEATVALSDVDVSPYDKIAFVGGPGAVGLADNEDAKRIAREAASRGKKLGAICIAPTILARAGVLRGKKATVWDSDGTQAALLRSEGAQYTGEEVTVDGDIVTANGPPAAEEFGEVFAKL